MLSIRTLTSYFYPLNLYSIVYVTASLIAGICTHWYGLTYLYAILLPILAGSVGAMVCLYYKKPWIVVFFMTATCIAGYLRTDFVTRKHQAFLELLSAHECTLYGTLSSWQETGNPRLPVRLTLDVHNLVTEDTHHQKMSGSHQVYIFTRQKPSCMVADVIRVRHVTTKAPSNTEYKLYLTKENVAATIFSQKFSYRLLRRPAYSFSRGLFYAREGLIKRLKAKLSTQTFNLCTSVFYGSPSAKKDIDPLKHYFKMWGVVHYLARSGLHLVIFILIWQFLMRLLPLPFRIKELFMLFLCTVYYLLSWPSIPFDRSYATYVLHKVTSLCLLRTYYLSTFAFVTLFMLVVNPMQLFFLDFQLSFGITCALALFNHLHTQRFLAYKNIAH